MSILDDFVRMRLYRERAAEFELLADGEGSPNVRLRYRIIARHYRELMDREEQADKRRMTDRIEQLQRQRKHAAALPASSDPQFLFMAAE
jgi:hypothetical protein